MRPRGSIQMSETFRLGALLTLAGGFLDTYTYFTRGGVFANAQTGNIVLLGINLTDGNWAMVLHYLIPILAFAAGVLVTEEVRRRVDGRRLHWRQVIVLAEVLLVAAVAFLPQRMNVLANVTVSFVCSMQVESFRKVRGATYATTMCTGNLRSGTEQFYHALWGDRKALRQGLTYFGVILFFIAGGAAGMLCVRRWGERAALVCAGLLLCAFLLMFCTGEDAELTDSAA